MPTPAISLPQSPPSKKSRVRVRVSNTAIPPIILLVLALLSSVGTADGAEISYAAHCSATVPESTPTGESITPSVFQLINGHFAGGEPLVSHDANPSPLLSSSFFFHPKSLHRTVSSDIFQLSGTLTFRGGSRSPPGNATVAVSTRPPRLRYRPRLSRFGRRKKLTFDLTGFWSASTGTLCMVGHGNARSAEGILLQPSSIVKLNYPNSSSISSSLVGGVVQSLDPIGSSDHFNPISVITYAQREYKYTAISDAESSCSKLNIGDELLGLGNSSCFYMKSFLVGPFKLDYRRDCSDRDCGPFERSTGFLPRFLSLNQVDCSEDGKVHMYVGFSNVSVFMSGTLFVPERALVAEGVWDPKRHRICLVACRVQNDSGALLPASVGDCSIRITLWFPAAQTIVSRSSVVGQIWSSRNENDPGYFDMVSFRSNKAYMNILHGVRYEYTKVDVARKSCVPDSDRSRGKKSYPDAKSFKDLRFDMSVKNVEGKTAWGHAIPVSIAETFYDSSYMVASPFRGSHQPALLGMDHSTWNVSYKIVFTFPNASLVINEPTEIFAEGIYNTRTGMICMVGCQYRDFPNDTKHLAYGNNMDCGIFINIQLPPLNPEAGEHLIGSIKSTREKKDPLFFAPLKISSYEMYTKQAAESIWRMDIEILMVLISLTGFCIFIGLQLFHIKKHPEVLPFISVTMLVVLTLGHMIPLVLNFEALFLMSRNKQNVLLWSGGWLEVNEVVVRVIMMVAFLLLCRLLQVVWFARSEDKGKEGGFWVAERRTFLLCLPLYFAGALIAWFVHLRSHETRLQRPYSISADRHSLWEDMISYAGLILDGFLLPQIIFNAFINSKDRALVPSFYIGTTVVRALPHLYDGYRARHYVPHFNQSYIYANPGGDFYSFAWNIIIPCGGILFAALTYVQQRFGGFFLRKKEQPGGYEMVPIVTQ